MKCPFLIIRKEVYDKTGKKIKEELELQDCIKNDCMVYDGATKLCSLLSSNMKTGVMIDDLKNGFKELRNDLHQRQDSLNTVLSSTVQSLQEALLGRFDILKKQNEVMVLGFDRLVETIVNKFEGLRVNFSDLNTNVTAISETMIDAHTKGNEAINASITTSAQTLIEQNSEFKSLFQSLQHTVDEIRNAHIQLSDNTVAFDEKLLNTIIEQGEGNVRVCEGTNAKLEIMRQVIEKMTVTSQANMEAMSNAIDRIVTSHQESVSKLDALVTGITDITSVLRNEVAGMKSEIVSAGSSLGSKIDTLSASFAETMKPGIDAMTELMRTEVAGLKSETISVLNGISNKFDLVSTALGETMKPGIDTITEIMKTEFSGLKQETVTALNGLAAKFDGLATAFSSEIKGNTEHMSIKMTELNATSTALKTDINALKESLVAKLDQLATAFSEVGQTQEQAVRGMTEQVSTVMTDSAKTQEQTFREMFERINAMMGESAKIQEQVLQNLATSFSGIGESIRSDVTDLKNNTSTLLGNFNKDIGTYIEAVRLEIANLKTDQITSLTNIQATVVQLQELFKNSSDSMGSMSDMMKNLNSNYIESLSKIAGLAEGMRKGVAKVGEGMHDSVKDLVKEMKSEIGSLEKQYEKTFGDIANLAGKFEDLNKRIKEMTKEVEKEFKDSFDRQEQLSNYTKTILEHIKSYFEKEEVRYKEEKVLKKKKEGLDHFDRATLYFYRGNYELAVNEIGKALEIEKTAEYLNLKGLLLAELGKFDESKKIYAEALKIEPNLAEINNNLGLLYLKMKKLDDAVVAFQEAVKKNVNYALAYVNLGKAYIEAEKYDDAIRAYEKALQIDPSNYDAQEAIKLYKEGKIGA
ncbi:tetratricopeptide repeat protein [candidate division WOR-3 bacterium]|nr:tetratricopeptide repeat protein [candidate division WOR-3 bacterium]